MRTKKAKLSRIRAALLLMGVAWLAAPPNLFCQSKTSASARLYIHVTVVPVLHSELPAEPRNSNTSLSFDLNTQTTQFDRQDSTREITDQTNGQAQPIVLTTVTLTAK